MTIALDKERVMSGRIAGNGGEGGREGTAEKNKVGRWSSTSEN